MGLKSYKPRSEGLRGRVSQDRKELTAQKPERRLTLDYLIGRQLKTPMGKVKPAVRQILRMGAYQLKFMDSVPDYAALYESVRRYLSHSIFFYNGRTFIIE